MLTEDKLRQCKLSNNEAEVAAFMLEQKEQIENMTIKEIAAKTYTAPATMVRLAQKLGYQGWNELKKEFVEEQKYLQSHFCSIDPNRPFEKEDSRMVIAAKISALEQETIKDTQSLLDDRTLLEALKLLGKSETIYYFAASNNLIYGMQFQFHMRRLSKRVEVVSWQGEVAFTAAMATPADCALIVSYSGETPILNKAARILKEHRVPILAMTSISQSSLQQMAQVVFHISTREKLYSKIGNFSTGISIQYLLDVLYASYFGRHYEDNWKEKQERSRQIETGRFATTDIMKEE